MSLNTSKCNRLTPLRFKGLNCPSCSCTEKSRKRGKQRDRSTFVTVTDISIDCVFTGSIIQTRLIDAIVHVHRTRLTSKTCHTTITSRVKPWNSVWNEIIWKNCKLFRRFISHVTTSETEIKLLFQPLKESCKLFQNYFCGIEHVGKHSSAAMSLWNNFEFHASFQALK